MLVKDIMSRQVAAASPDDTALYAADLMNRYDVGAIPVVEGHTVRGIVTDRDIVLRFIARKKDCSTVRLKDVMSCVTSCVSSDAPVGEALAQMSRRQVRRLPVVDNGRVVGILSLADVARLKPSVEIAQTISEISVRT